MPKSRPVDARADVRACVPPVFDCRTQLRIIISESCMTHFGNFFFQIGFEKFSSFYPGSDSSSLSSSDSNSDSCSDEFFIVKPLE